MYGDKIYLVDIFGLNKRRIVQFRDKITSFGFAILQGIHYSVQKRRRTFRAFSLSLIPIRPPSDY